MALKDKKICVGTGLVALDAVVNGDPKNPSKLFAGGSCGNVLAILAYLGWNTFPVSRLAKNKASVHLVKDLGAFGVNTTHLSCDREGSTPIIIQRLLKTKTGGYKHKFEFRDPFTGKRLPKYKPVSEEIARELEEKLPVPTVFYFDRVNTGAVALAKYFFKNNKTLIFFEPSSMKRTRLFQEAAAHSHVIKFSDERLPDYARLFRSQLAPLEIETLGKEGIKYRFSHSKRSVKWISVPGYLIEKPVDTVGAGDWCSAGIIASLFPKGVESLKTLTLDSLAKAFAYGQALGALNCLFMGARGLMYHLAPKAANTLANSLIKGKDNSIAPLKPLPARHKNEEIKYTDITLLYS